MSDPSSGEGPDTIDRLLREIAELRASRRRLASSGHADRRVIERELHDGMQQHLAALAVNLQLLQRTDRGVGAADALVDEMRAIVRDAFDESARLATRIYPQVLDGRGLAAALRSAASTAGITANVDVAAGVDDPALAGDASETIATLYWTWSDVLASAGSGSEARISILDADRGLAFEITLAGRVPEADFERLRDRIEALDGRVSIDAPEDGRTLIQAWLPLPR